MTKRDFCAPRSTFVTSYLQSFIVIRCLGSVQGLFFLPCPVCKAQTLIKANMLTWKTICRHPAWQGQPKTSNAQGSMANSAGLCSSSYSPMLSTLLYTTFPLFLLQSRECKEKQWRQVWPPEMGASFLSVNLMNFLLLGATTITATPLEVTYLH